MKINLKKEKGITMTALVITVIILLILTNMIVYNAQDKKDIDDLTNLYNDIEILNTKVEEFYNTNGTIPAKIKYTNISDLKSANILSNNNDTGDFYVIDLQAMQGLTLNYGREYDDLISEVTDSGIDTSSKELSEDTKNELTTIANNYSDLYIINSNSHNIFYVKGITVSEKTGDKKYYTNYTTPDETTVDLRYIDGILIPDGYYYIGKVDDNWKKIADNESGTIIISTDKTENVETSTENQYYWVKKISISGTQDFSTLSFKDETEKDKFLKSVTHYKGYFKNRKDESKAVYLPIDENKWSETYTENTKYVDKNGDIAYIPKGFRVSLAEGTNEIKDGLVITDNVENNISTGNEFVWVPVDDFSEFVREDFGDTKISSEDFITTGLTESKYYEISANGLNVNETGTTSTKEVQEMYKSIKKYKGFYVGRYETGIDGDTARTLETASDISMAPVIKKGKKIYNYIKWGNSMTDETGGAVEKARSMYENSTLCYGVQWDAILRWLKSFSEISDDITNSTSIGNYDTDGNIATTGYDEAYQLKNIYDLAGNVAEWTMEAYGTDTRVLRGGKSGTTDNMTTRETASPNSINGLYGFRVTLYVKD